MILDVCCGGKTMYHGWEINLGDNIVFMDIRKKPERTWTGGKGYEARMPEVKPDIKADMNHLPFRAHIFEAIIFDPPHLQVNMTSFMVERYGGWDKPQSYRIMIRVNDEFARVLKPNGLLLMKVLAIDSRTYISLLSNFSFFLPIEYLSQSNLSEQKVGWYVAVLKPYFATSLSAHDKQTLSEPAQTTVGLPLHLQHG